MEIQKARYKPAASKRARNLPLIFGVLLLIVSMIGYTAAALAKPLPRLDPTLIQLDSVPSADVAISWPAGQGVIGTVEDGVLAASSEQETVKPIASMTKLITALAILEAQPLEVGQQGVTYTLTSEDVVIYQSYIAKLGSVMPIRAGQQLTQYHALQALLLPSANNIADMLAIREFGSLESYIVYANQMLGRFGLSNTVVADASGFSPRTVSTPSEMFEIGTRALSHPVLAEIVAQKEAVIPVSGLIRNTNQLLSDPSVVGLKTGTTDEAGSCLLFAFTHQLDSGETTTVVGAVMGVPNWPQLYREVRTLITTARSGFGTIVVVPDDTIVGSIEAPWGDTAEIVVSDELSMVGWRGKEYSPELEVSAIEGPASASTEVGVVRVEDKSRTIVLTDAIDPPDFWWRLVNYW